MKKTTLQDFAIAVSEAEIAIGQVLLGLSENYPINIAAIQVKTVRSHDGKAHISRLYLEYSIENTALLDEGNYLSE